MTAAAPPASTWSPVPLAEIVAAVQAGDVVGPIPRLLPRADGAALLYPGEVHSLAGEPEAGKGWMMLAETARLLHAGQRVAYIDGEDAPETIVTRLLALGAPADAVAHGLAYVRPEAGPHPGAVENLIAAGPYALAVLDGQTELYALLGLDPYANQDVPRFLRALARPLAAAGAAVVLIDHVTKNADTRGRWAIGGQHKLAGIAVAYTVETIEASSRQHAGRAKVIVQKDRHGHVRAHAAGKTIAVATITPAAGGDRVTVTIDPPDGTDAAGGFRPTALMERLSLFIESNPGQSVRAILDGTRGNRDARIRALDLLAAEGFIERSVDSRSTRHRSIRPFRETPETPTVPTVPTAFPDRSQERHVPTVPSVPSPYKEGTGTGNVPGPHRVTVPTASVPLNALTADHDSGGLS